jgi:probable HAF family extracellular repeat protein
MRTAHRILGALTIVAFGSSLSALASSHYTVVPLEGGMYGGSAYALNSAGIVAGFRNWGSGQHRPTAWAPDGSPLQAGTLGGLAGHFCGINDCGQVVGFDDPHHAQHAFTATIGGTAVDLHPLIPGNPDRSSAVAVNNGGQIAVFAGPNSGGGAPYLFDGTAMNALPIPPGSPYAEPSAINNHGQVVGACAKDGYGAGRALLWQNGQFIDLGATTERPYSAALGINDRGDAVGMVHAGSGPGLPLAAAWIDGQVAVLGTLPDGYDSSTAYGINITRKVVGTASRPDNPRHAFIWEDGVMTDLNTLIPLGSGWELYDAFAINDVGWIAGYGRSPTGQYSGYLLTPEPGALWLLGLAAVVLRRRGR